MQLLIYSSIISSGKYTYHQDPDSECVKKTVNVVKQLCERFKGSHRCIYIDRFYTSKELRMKKASPEFKDMVRGDYKAHTYEYITTDGKANKYGLVLWKDRDIVYALTSCVNTNERGHCYRQSAQGRIILERPLVIGEYNENMGGVDVADMRRLNCNSTLMGKHRWWLKLFFYILDVGTSNALILYREVMNNTTMNVVDYKKQLVYLLCGDRITSVEK